MTQDEEIERQNEKIQFLARTNMLYSDWEHRSTQVTSDLIRKGIEEAKINAELRAEIEQLKQRPWVGLTDDDVLQIRENVQIVEGLSLLVSMTRAIEAKLKEKNT
jgi:cupin superfamily acireductone dioxygenase involved in methionine salvage